jgi:hypothetical protein
MVEHPDRSTAAEEGPKGVEVVEDSVTGLEELDDEALAANRSAPGS